MKLLFLGSGSAFTVGTDNFQSNLLLIGDNGQKLLLDCGSDIRFSLYAAQLSYLDITNIYISHLHSDHVGGLEYVGFSTKFDPRCNRPKLYLSKDLADDLWSRSLSGGMRSIGGDIADLETFYEVKEIGHNRAFQWENINFELVKVVHINNGYFVMPSYGVFFEVEGTKVFVTTDTTLCLECLNPYYEQADLIFQDCETSSFPTNVHANYSQLLGLPKTIRNKMWLYGYQPGIAIDAKKDGFCGFVKRGQFFELGMEKIAIPEPPKVA